MTTIESNFKVLVAPFEILNSNLDANEKLVLLVLHSYTNPHTSQAFPAISSLSKLTSLSRSTVQRTIKSLEEKGCLNREARFEYDPKMKTARQTSNIYRLNATPCQPDTLPRVNLTPSPVSDCDTPPCQDDTQSINYDQSIKEIDRLISNATISQFLKSNTENLKMDHIQSIADLYELVKNEKGYSDLMMVEVTDRVLRTYKSDFKACLKTSVFNELNKKRVDQPYKRTGAARAGSAAAASRKPKIDIVKIEGDKESLSQQEIDKIKAKARLLDSGKQSEEADEFDFAEERPF